MQRARHVRVMHFEPFSLAKVALHAVKSSFFAWPARKGVVLTSWARVGAQVCAQ